MRVPKMVKNGHNSVLHISASAQEDSCSKKSRTDTKPKTFFESWKANKNHFRPISEQACALNQTTDDHYPLVKTNKWKNSVHPRLGSLMVLYSTSCHCKANGAIFSFEA